MGVFAQEDHTLFSPSGAEEEPSEAEQRGEVDFDNLQRTTTKQSRKNKAPFYASIDAGGNSIKKKKAAPLWPGEELDNDRVRDLGARVCVLLRIGLAVFPSGGEFLELVT